jgi:glycosyl-4,4'-diaponeurosporenoate acyltransferase
MQLIFLPETTTILLCFVVWPILQGIAAVICTRLPERFFDYTAFFYRVHRWEQEGEFYQTVFRVRRWKKYLPDGAALVKRGFKKKKLVDFSNANLEKYLQESCRAEMIHWLGILPFWLFGFFTPPVVIVYMLFYALAVNLPCVITQRYNRPRIIRIARHQTVKKAS